MEADRALAFFPFFHHITFMADTIIVYASKRGNTEKMAKAISEELTSRGIENILKNTFEVRPAELTDYKFILLGSSTWSDGDLAVDFIEFEKGMDNLNLKGHYGAVFGPGSSRFRFFCEAVNILEAKLRSLGSRILLPSLKVNEMSGNEEEESREWAAVLADEISQIV